MWRAESAEIHSNEFVFVLQPAYVFMRASERACVCVCVIVFACVRACVCVVFVFRNNLRCVEAIKTAVCARGRESAQRERILERAGPGELVSNGFLCGNQHRIVC